MTAIKIIQQYETIFDFNEDVSKDSIKKLFQKEICHGHFYSNHVNIRVKHRVKVGMYYIWLYFQHFTYGHTKPLKQCGKFHIKITDHAGSKGIDLNEDARFNTQPWSTNTEYLNAKDLINIIAHCKRLNNLKSFL